MNLFFEQEYILFEILDILYLDQANIKMNNSNRNFDALSFRLESDTLLETDKQQIEVSDNSICYVPSNLSYMRQSKRDKMIVVHFKAFNYHAEQIEYFYPENPKKYRGLFTQILDCWNKKEVSYKNDCASLLSKILSQLYKDNQPPVSNNRIYNSLVYIHQNYMRSDFSLTEAAAKSFISETYFRKLFKQEFNISPKHYIICRRMEYAKALILSGYFSIREIAAQCGYNDEKHFSSEFKRYTGIQPTQYRYNYN